LNYRNLKKPFFAIFKVARPVAFDTETRPETIETNTHKNESRDSITDLYHGLRVCWQINLFILYCHRIKYEYFPGDAASLYVR